MKGSVKWFNATKGFGFIQGEDGKDYFVHKNEILSGSVQSLWDGEAVEFEPGDSPKGPKAFKVQPTSPQRTPPPSA